jgi:hypothetical protein
MQVSVRKYRAGKVSAVSISPLRYVDYPFQKNTEGYGKVKSIALRRHLNPNNIIVPSSPGSSFSDWCMPAQPEEYMKCRQYDFY